MKQKKLMLLGGLSYLIPVIQEAHKLGIYVITADYLPDNIAHRYSDEYCNVSIIDKEAVLAEAVRLQIDGILSHAVDPGVLTAAYVTERMGLPYQCSYDAACILQDKSLFRKFLMDNGFNCPKAEGYNAFEDAAADSGRFGWPVIVKPVDSAGSKGVTKVDSPEHLKEAVEIAIKMSMSGRFIVEEFLDVDGFQSSADVFTIDGKLVYSTYSDQLFDPEAPNPFTPAVEIWPSTISGVHQSILDKELQRLFTLLGVKSGIYNVESRVCTDGKAYIMEVSPRGGGNRIAELQGMATGQNLIRNEILKAMGMPLEPMQMPVYDGVWCNFILHSLSSGILKSIDIDESFRYAHVMSASFTKGIGDPIDAFMGANQSLGTLFLRFGSRNELDEALVAQDEWLDIRLEEVL